MVGKKTERILTYFVLCLFVIILVFPFIWLLSSSFKDSRGIFSPEFSLIPRDFETGEISFTLDNYKSAIEYMNFPVLFFNTFLVAIINTVTNTFLNSLAGYSFARLRFKGRELLFRLILTSMMIPGTVLLVPNMIIINKLGLYDHLGALVVPFVISVYNIFLMRQHFLTLPRELEESGIVDGASWYKVFLKIALPLARPILVTLGIFTFMWNYNNFLWPLVVINSPENYTIALGLGALLSTLKQAENYPIMIATSVIVAVPLIVIFMFLQKHIMKGISAGGVKG
ncbi:carbohydrate ABC transporter permease [Paenibacillus sp. JSM ZJ436]|uniref:carbohydrate ABC transporter permease n=1 Tax=Paenibacillus sp. JSM ZJ436 TaxID=3376190 RepID=UPI0037AF9AD2